MEEKRESKKAPTPAPEVTVIVPVYNAGRYLAACLDSILGVSAPSIEVIAVDDGSTDNSATVLATRATADPRLKVLTLPNGGPSRARNAALDIARGEWICFVDADDIADPLLLPLLTRYSSFAEVDIVAATLDRFTTDVPPSPASLPAPQILDPVEAAIRVLYQQPGLDASSSGKLFRRRLFEEMRYTPGRLYEDLELIPQVILRARQVAFLNIPLYHYRYTPGSILDRFTMHRLDVLTVTENLYNKMTDPRLRRAAADRCLSAAFNMLCMLRMNKVDAPAEIDRCVKIIRRHRGAALLDRRVRLKNKLAIIASYLLGPRGSARLGRLVYHR